MQVRTLHRHTTIAAGLAALLLLGAPAALAAPGGKGGDAVIEPVAFTATSITVTSSKALSNVVLDFCDGATQRFEDLHESRTGTFSGTGDHADAPLRGAWVKSGRNHSGDGPGYGAYLLSSIECEQTPAPTPEPSATPTPTPSSEPTPDPSPEPSPEPSPAPSPAPTPEPSDEPTPEPDEDPDPEPEPTPEPDDDVASTVLERTPPPAPTPDPAPTPAPAPTPDLAPQVLGVVLERPVTVAADVEVAAAATTLPETGADGRTLLLAALAALTAGVALVRRERFGQ